MKPLVNLEDAGVQALRSKNRRRSRKKIPMVMGKGEFRDYWVFRGATAKIQPGECVALLDPSGGDRATSLTRLMAGLITPDEGSVRRRGEALMLTRPTKRKLKSLSIGQAGRMLAGIYGMTDAQVDARIDDVMELAGLAEKPWLPVEELDGSQLRQLSFAAGTSTDARLLGLQNMAMVGSVEFKAQCVPRLRELMADGVALILDDSDPLLVSTLASRALLIRRRKLVPMTTVEAVELLRKWAQENRFARKEKKRLLQEEDDDDDDTTFM
ncbi:MAG: hypothetical protein K0U60_00055 [Actinomycetia bacterium]|nr:hypothetical protein [Actinomycetes bacterium]MCH9801245.1 hypothetical protein [Actinomycetes bacterium]